jgi:transketolase
MPDLHAPNATFEIGKAITLKEGTDVTFIAIGEPLHQALLAAEKLETEFGLSCRVISMHTLKPFDTQALVNAARNTKALITVEEHSVYGGLGETCAGILMECGISVPFRRVGFPDEYTVTGSQSEIYNYYGISAEGLAQTARAALAREEAA